MSKNIMLTRIINPLKVSKELEALEAKKDLKDAKKALRDIKKHGTVAWNDIKCELNL